jgi:type I restriction enzyme S subunit
MKHVEPDDFIIHLRSFQGGIEHSRHRGKVSTAYTVLTPGRDAEPRYFRWLLKSDGYIQELRTTVNQLRDGQSIKYRDFAKVALPLPPLPQQRAIADYLDRETAQIDALIEEQQHLIEQLRERRSAIITHAVADGRSSRIPLRRIVEVIDCAHVTAEFVEEDQRFPVVSIKECQGAEVNLADCRYTTEAFFELLRAGGRTPKAGDLLFIRNVSVGLVAAVPPHVPPFALGQETVLLRRKTAEADPSFLRYALLTAEARHAIDQAMIGSTFRRINVAAIRSLPIAWGAIADQRATVRRLDAETGRIDSIIRETEWLIEISRERRTALITAAVTGQVAIPS